VSVAIMLERARFYWTLSDNLDALAEELRNLLRKKDMDGAKKRLERSPSPAATIALAGLNESDRGADAAEEAMAGATARTRLTLERNLAFLGTVGNNAPFVGLLGTVIGIIQAFDALKANQTAAATTSNAAAGAAQALQNAQATLGATGRVMGTIAEALVATAIGLFVAIPAVAAFNYFQRKVRAIVASGETLSHVVLAQLKAEPATAGAAVSSAAAGDFSDRRGNIKKGEKTADEKKADEKKGEE
jgi:biopolymer transport protein ExbB